MTHTSTCGIVATYVIKLLWTSLYYFWYTVVQDSTSSVIHDNQFQILNTLRSMFKSDRLFGRWATVKKTVEVKELRIKWLQMNLEGRGYELLKPSRNFLAEVEQKSSNVIPLDIGVLRLIVFGANSYRHFGSRPVSIFWIVDICGFSLCPTYHNRHPNCTKLCTSACYSHFPFFFFLPYNDGNPFGGGQQYI